MPLAKDQRAFLAWVFCKEPIQEPVFVADMPGFLGKALRGFDINGMICDGEDVIVTKRIDNEFYQTDILTL